MLFKSKKFAVLGLALAAVVASAGISLAYWAASVSGNNDNANGTVQIGVGHAVTTTVVVSDESGTAALVPATRAVGSEVESVTLDFVVDFNSTAEAANGTLGHLTVTATSVTVGTHTDDAITAYVNIALPAVADIYADGATVTASPVITLSEPTLADYASVAGKTITITFNFAVAIA